MQVYSRYPISMAFPLSATQTVEIKGMNQHELVVDHPYMTLVSEDEWKAIQEKYGENGTISKTTLFSGSNPFIFTAKNANEATALMKDSQPVIPEKFLIGSLEELDHPEIKKKKLK